MARIAINGLGRIGRAAFKVIMDTDGAISDSYGVRAIPTTIILDRDGSVLYRGHDINAAERAVSGAL